MIATCPGCAKRYRLPEGAVPAGGRNVRCAACSHGWTILPGGEDAAAEAVDPNRVSSRKQGDAVAEPTGIPSSLPVSTSATPPSARKPVDIGMAIGPSVGTPVDDIALSPMTAPRANTLTASIPTANPSGDRATSPLVAAPLAPAVTVPDYDPLTARATMSFAEMRDTMTPPRRSGIGPAAFVTAVVMIVVLAVAALAVIEFAPEQTFNPPRLGLPAVHLPLKSASLSVPRLPPLRLVRVPIVGASLDRLIYPPPPSASPLRISAKGERRTLANGTLVLTITGSVANPSDATAALTAIDAALLDTAGHLAFHWRIPAPVSAIAAHSSVAFETVAANFPGGATVIRLRPC